MQNRKHMIDKSFIFQYDNDAKHTAIALQIILR